MNRQETFFADSKVEMIASFYEAVTRSGGNVPWESVKNITVNELVNLLCPNKIRFYYDEKAVTSPAMDQRHDVSNADIDNIALAISNLPPRGFTLK